MKYEWIEREHIFADDRPFRSCHASTLAVLPDGDVIAAWFGGSREGAPDVAIWAARRTRDGWTPPVKIADREGVPHWNPVLFRRNDGELFLFYKVGHRIADWSTMVMRSRDGGRTWTEPKPLVPGDVGGRGPVKNKPITLSDGAIVAPASVEPAWDAFVDLSYDGGETWERSAFVPLDRRRIRHKGIIQPTLWESAPGRVHMLCRSTEGSIFRSDSEDGGRTWCAAYPTDLPNNNSGIDLDRLDDGTLVLAYNPVRQPPDQLKGPRTPLVLRISRDNGETWHDEWLIDQGEGQYSYPSVVAVGRDIHMTYTWRRERIAYARIRLTD